MDDSATNQVEKTSNNPTGIGGFKHNPQNRSDGRWSKDNSFSYWYNKFKAMTVTELKQWMADNPEDVRSVASDLAYRRVFNSQKDLKEFQEVADRSEGKARASMDITSAGQVLNIALVEFLDGTKDKSTDTN